MRKLLLSFCVFITVTGYSYAGVLENHTAHILQQIEVSEENFNKYLSSEKVLPDNTALSAVVIVERPEGFDDTEDVYQYHILLVDNESGKVISSAAKEEPLVLDVTRLTDIIIDTAPYTVQKNNWAFGISISTTGSSRMTPFFETRMSLYIQKGSSLVKILDGFPIREEEGQMEGICAKYYDKTKRILIMSDNATKGFKNITIKETFNHIETKSDEQEEECITVFTETKIKHTTLKFDGKEYK
ncbi:hypothetical protein Dip510_000773 [Elusimicrobium posterum]|uniref:hypothetical protein n=1 Tax=Elusimicrobium posterum TaxID=3116653 RepID=UPI003C78E5B6